MNRDNRVFGRFWTITALLIATGMASAEDLTGVDEFICAAGQAQICVEADTCYATTAWELSMPEFVVIDTGKRTVSTTRASGLNRSSSFSSRERTDDLIFLQGMENGRAFSFVIHEATGRLTATIARDGAVVTVFGSCTDTKL